MIWSAATSAATSALYHLLLAKRWHAVSDCRPASRPRQQGNESIVTALKCQSKSPISCHGGKHTALPLVFVPVFVSHLRRLPWPALTQQMRSVQQLRLWQRITLPVGEAGKKIQLCLWCSFGCQHMLNTITASTGWSLKWCGWRAVLPGSFNYSPVLAISDSTRSGELWRYLPSLDQKNHADFNFLQNAGFLLLFIPFFVLFMNIRGSGFLHQMGFGDWFLQWTKLANEETQGT